MKAELNFIDLIIGGVVAMSLIFGLMKGFLREIFSLIFFVFAIIIASLFYTDVGDMFVKDHTRSTEVYKKNEKRTGEADQIIAGIATNRPVMSKEQRGRNVADFAGFLIIFFLILVIGSIVTYFMKKILIRGPMKSVDRILGAFFGLVRGILICCILVFGARKLDVSTESVNRSFLVNVIIDDTIHLLEGILPETDLSPGREG